MSKKISVGLLFSVVIAICVVFTTTGAMAQTRPLECTSTDGKLKLTPSPEWDFPTFDDGSMGLCGDRPGKFYGFRASSSNPKFLAKINKIYFYIPSDPLNPIDVYDAANPCAGGTSGWGSGVCNGVVVTAESYSGANDPYIDIGFCTSGDEPGYGLISAVFDTGTGGELACVATASPTIVGGIIGPGDDISVVVPTSDTEDVDLPLDGCVQIKRHPFTGAIQNFKYCDGSQIPKRSSWELDEAIVHFGDPRNPGGGGGIIATTGGSTVYWGWAPPNNYYCLGTYCDKSTPVSWQPSPCPYNCPE